MPNAPLLQAFVDAELGRSADLIARTLLAIQAQLRQPGDAPLSASERQHHFDLSNALVQHQVSYQRRFVDALRDAVVADMAPGATEPSAPVASSSGLGGLQLMDEHRVETEIGLSRAIQEIDAAAEWELRELQTFTSTLRGLDHTTAESNPFRPRVYAQALAEAAQGLPLPPPQQALLLRVSATAMAPLLKSAWAAATTRLERQGVTPSIYRTVVFAQGAAAPPEAVNVTEPGALDALRRTMPAGLASSAAAGDLDNALARVEALLNRLPPSADASGAAPRLLEHRAALLATTGASLERQVIELIARLFEVIVSDPGLHPALRAQLGRLQVSALRIALNDPAMLDHHGHPVWRFMAQLVNAASGYPHAADPRLGALLAFSGHLIDDLTVGPQGAAAYARSLAALDNFLDGQLHEQQEGARRAIETLLRAEQADQLQLQFSTRIAAQLAPVPATPLVRRFISGTWARVLANAVIAHGDDSDVTSGYMRALDDLVWSLQPPDHPQSRQRLLAMLPGLLQKLRAGAASVDLPASECQAVLDDLVIVHAAALKPGPRPSPVPDQATTAEDIVRRMREETALPPDDAMPFSDSLIDVASMDTVPAALLTEPAERRTEDPCEWVDRLPLGVRQRIFLKGRWTQTQLLWRSPRGTYFVYAGEAPGRTHSLTQRALERLRQAELVDTVEAHSVIQRAVNALVRQRDAVG